MEKRYTHPIFTILILLVFLISLFFITGCDSGTLDECTSYSECTDGCADGELSECSTCTDECTDCSDECMDE